MLNGIAIRISCAGSSVLIEVDEHSMIKQFSFAVVGDRLRGTEKQWVVYLTRYYSYSYICIWFT